MEQHFAQFGPDKALYDHYLPAAALSLPPYPLDFMANPGETIYIYKYEKMKEEMEKEKEKEEIEKEEMKEGMERTNS